MPFLVTGAALPHFETFRKDQVPFTREPHVTVQKRGTVTLNAAAYGLLGAPEAVELLYDPGEKLLGLRAVSTRESHAVFVRSSTQSPKGPWVLSAMAFIHYWEIDTTATRRWIARLEGDTLIVPLGEDGEVVSRTRRAKRTIADTSSRHRPRPRPGR